MKSKSRTLLFCYFQIIMPKREKSLLRFSEILFIPKITKIVSTDEQAIIAKRGKTS